MSISESMKWTDLEILGLGASETSVDSHRWEGAASLSHIKAWSTGSKSKSCGFSTFHYCACLLLLLHLNMKPWNILLPQWKAKWYKMNIWVCGPILWRAEKEKNITRQSEDIDDFPDDTFIKGWLPFLLMRGKNSLVKVSVSWKSFSCLEFKITLKFLILTLWEHRKPISCIT